jgi:hypothetical protein
MKREILISVQQTLLKKTYFISFSKKPYTQTYLQIGQQFAVGCFMRVERREDKF